jgi:hypothetical protein
MDGVALLPVELLELVLRLLPPRALLAAVQVCRRWREVGEAPGLWAWVCLRVDTGNPAEWMGSRRLAAVRLVVVGAVAEELHRLEVQHPGLRIVDIRFITISSCCSALLAGAVTTLREAGIPGRFLAREQAESILAGLGAPGRGEAVRVRSSSLLSVEPDLLGRSVAAMTARGVAGGHAGPGGPEGLVGSLVRASLGRLLLARCSAVEQRSAGAGQDCGGATGGLGGGGVAAGGRHQAPPAPRHQPRLVAACWSLLHI